MKKLKATVTYTVPHWPYCNSDDLTHRGDVTAMRCQFCAKTKLGNRCMLYNKDLLSDGKMVEKLKVCCEATAGITAEIVSENIEPAAPTIPPKDLMKHTLDLYIKTVNDLKNQGYPQPMAETVARNFILGGQQ